MLAKPGQATVDSAWQAYMASLPPCLLLQRTSVSYTVKLKLSASDRTASGSLWTDSDPRLHPDRDTCDPAKISMDVIFWEPLGDR